jgi:hypothetical protein
MSELITESLGGRWADDAEQWAYSVASAVKSHYPINGVPSEIEEAVAALVRDGQAFSATAEAIIKMLRAEKVCRPM